MWLLVLAVQFLITGFFIFYLISLRPIECVRFVHFRRIGKVIATENVFLFVHTHISQRTHYGLRKSLTFLPSDATGRTMTVGVTMMLRGDDGPLIMVHVRSSRHNSKRC
jgi:hypothetical protein